MPNNFGNDNEVRCSFCGKPQSQAKRLISGNGVYICDECVELCMDIIADEDSLHRGRPQPKNEPRAEMVLPKPQEIKKQLDEYVVGQDEAKMTLAVAVYNHYKRIFFSGEDGGVEIAKSNVLLLGPTGVGKTYLAQTLAKLLDVPFAIAVRNDSDGSRLCRRRRRKHPRCVSFRQQITTLSVPSTASSMSMRSIRSPEVRKPVHYARRQWRGCAAGAAQNFEGTIAGVPPKGGRKHPQQEVINIDTSNILFICGGAFDGLKSVIQRRTEAQTLGFNSVIKSKNELDNTEWMKEVTPHDLVKFGLIPELVGRLPVITALSDLDKAALVRILTEPKNCLVSQYKKLFDLDKVDLEFTPEALDAIAEKTIARKTGARGLRSIMEDTLKNLMFEVPSDYTIEKITVTKDSVENGAAPEIVHNPDRVPVKIKMTQPKRRARKDSAS